MKKIMMIIVVTLMTILLSGFAKVVADCVEKEYTTTIDTEKLSFPFFVIGVCDNEFTIVYDESTEEIVCVRFSKEIGTRIKKDRCLIENYLRFSHSEAYFSYFVEDGNGICFDIIELWSEKKQTNLREREDIACSAGTSLSIFTYNSETEQIAYTFSDSVSDSVSSYFITPSSTQKIATLNTCHFQINVFHSFEDIHLEQVDYRLDDLEFKIAMFSTANSNLKHLYSYAKIDDTHYTILDIAPSKELDLEPAEKYTIGVSCEIPEYFKIFKKINIETAEKCYSVPFSVFKEFLNTL